MPSSSVLQKTFTEWGHSIKDAYGHVIHGDDPGSFSTYVFIARARPTSIHQDYVEKYDLGMTFTEVNGRAYVNHVVPDSDADRAGIQPQDCLQLAMSPPPWRLEEEGGGMCDDKSIRYVLNCEKKGMRTSFDDLREMFEGCAINRSNEELFSSKNASFLDRSSRKMSLKYTLRKTTQEVVGRCTSLSLSSVCLGDVPVHPAEKEPIFMVFRHTQSKQRLVPANTQNVGLPSFHLGDECQRAACIVKRLAPTNETSFEQDSESLDEDGQPKPKDESGKNNASFEALDTVEASTIRRMIQNAVGLAFVKASKVVLGLSFHFGSGIVIGRLEDGSWSAPSAIGMYGAGLGLQFGLEVADYIFVIQTNDALDHFRRGTNYTVGGHFGAAVGGIGREAIGAASLSPKNNPKLTDDEELEASSTKKGNSVAPIVAYAKSQGLYFGVSLEGSKIFVREDINHRTYQFLTGRECSTNEILSGIVPPPSEAEDLYATLHNVVFAHEIAQLPRPPDILQQDIRQNWRYDSETLFKRDADTSDFSVSSDFDQKEELDQYEAEVKDFMYEGVSVQRIISGASGKGQCCLERRILWLVLPDEGSMRLGFLSKSTDGPGIGGDESDVYSRGRSLGSAMSNDDDGSLGSSTDRSNHVEGNISRKFSMKLTDVISIERCPKMNNVLKSATIDASRLIKIEDVGGKVLLFITNNIPEAEVLFSGLKLLVEKETSRIGIRGGKANEQRQQEFKVRHSLKEEVEDEFKEFPLNEEKSEMNNENVITSNSFKEEPTQDPRNKTTENNIEEQSFTMNASHASNSHGSISSYDNSGEFEDSSQRERTSMRYVQGQVVQGQVIHTQIATNVAVPLPLPLCRALLLDSASPLMKHWAIDRGDFNFSHGDWILKDSLSPRSVNYPNLQGLELIAKGNMSGASRTMSFERIRKGQRIGLLETWVVDLDEKDKFVFNIVENMPRRGFSLKIRVAVRPSDLKNSDVSVVAEIVPLGKNTSNQTIVHRAFNLVVKELQSRYGLGDGGLLGGLLKINLPTQNDVEKRPLSTMTCTQSNTKKMGKNDTDFSDDSKLQLHDLNASSNEWVQFGNNKNDNAFDTSSQCNNQLETNPLQDQKEVLKTETSIYTSFSEMNNQDEQKHMFIPQDPNEEKCEIQTPQRQRKTKKEIDRPPTPSMKQRMKNEIEAKNSKPSPLVNSINHDFVQDEQNFKPVNPIKIDVKPLPKIRLDLMPSPREVDEELEDDW